MVVHLHIGPELPKADAVFEWFKSGIDNIFRHGF